MTIEDIKRYPFSERDRLFIDTNIWLYAYGPDAYKFENRCATTYGQELARIRVAGCQVFINEIVLSEFVNTYAREEWKDFKEDKGNIEFKEYRDSRDFKSIAEDIWYGVNSILDMIKDCNCIETKFSKLKAKSFIDIYKAQSSDFNDLIIKSICEEGSFKLVTNDKDFKDDTITIITGNPIVL